MDSIIKIFVSILDDICVILNQDTNYETKSLSNCYTFLCETFP